MSAPDPFGLTDYGDEFDAEVRDIQNRREASFVYRYGMNLTRSVRQAADEARSADLKRLREIGEIRRQRTAS